MKFEQVCPGNGTVVNIFSGNKKTNFRLKVLGTNHQTHILPIIVYLSSGYGPKAKLINNNP